MTSALKPDKNFSNQKLLVLWLKKKDEPDNFQGGVKNNLYEQEQKYFLYSFSKLTWSCLYNKNELNDFKMSSLMTLHKGKPKYQHLVKCKLTYS